MNQGPFPHHHEVFVISPQEQTHSEGDTASKGAACNECNIYRDQHQAEEDTAATEANVEEHIDARTASRTHGRCNYRVEPLNLNEDFQQVDGVNIFDSPKANVGVIFANLETVPRTDGIRRALAWLRVVKRQLPRRSHTRSSIGQCTRSYTPTRCDEANSPPNQHGHHRCRNSPNVVSSIPDLCDQIRRNDLQPQPSNYHLVRDEEALQRRWSMVTHVGVASTTMPKKTSEPNLRLHSQTPNIVTNKKSNGMKCMIGSMASQTAMQSVTSAHGMTPTSPDAAPPSLADYANGDTFDTDLDGVVCFITRLHAVVWLQNFRPTVVEKYDGRSDPKLWLKTYSTALRSAHASNK